jgi:hypothetical protein
LEVDMSRSFLIAVTMLAALVAPAAGAEVPAQYRGLWCDGSKGYYRCREATSEAYLDIRRDRINLSEEGDCRITAVTSSAKGHRLRVYSPRTYSRTHRNMSICGSTPAVVCILTRLRPRQPGGNMTGDDAWSGGMSAIIASGSRRHTGRHTSSTSTS